MKKSRRKAHSYRWLQVLFAASFSLPYHAERLRRSNDRLFRLAVGLVLGLFTHFCLPKICIPATAISPDLANVLNTVAKICGSLLVGVFGTDFIVRGLCPSLFFVPQAISMHSMGLLYVTTDPSECHKYMEECVAAHDSALPVKVICISGRHLFREPTYDCGGEIKNTPLHSLAKEGKLEVIMPKAQATNPTIKYRYGTYTSDYKTTHGIKNMTQFLTEIKNGRSFLKESRNRMFEHDILCMWRVIILSQHCIIQNYFPNRSGTHSYLSPCFVYRKTDSASNGYYDTYSDMFEMIKKDALAH